MEQKAGDSLPILAALARLHTEQKKPELAERELSRYIEQQPEYWAFQMLAANYKARGDMKRWQETLERSLGTEETGLEHVAGPGCSLPITSWNRASGRRRRNTPRPLGSRSPLRDVVRQRCAEGMKDWPRAEQWAQRQTERYPEQPDTPVPLVSVLREDRPG